MAVSEKCFHYFLPFSDLLFMQWIAEAAVLTQVMSQSGHLVQWWTTAALKVNSPFIFLLGSPFFSCLNINS